MMDIGAKLREARLAAQLTQEQAAEDLGISRQTMSNWENGKTYPDIVSVIKMSDLYAISLDCLLKDPQKAALPDYINYLKESTNTSNSRSRLSKIILVAMYLGIWSFALIVFWCFISGSDAMGYSLVVLWFILPMATLVISLLIGKNDFWRQRKWLAAPVFGVMHMLAEYLTFSTANMLAFDKINAPQLWMLLPCAAVSALGLWIGTVVNRKNAEK